MPKEVGLREAWDSSEIRASLAAGRWRRQQAGAEQVHRARKPSNCRGSQRSFVDHENLGLGVTGAAAVGQPSWLGSGDPMPPRLPTA